MGLYIYIDESDRLEMKNVKDSDVNSLFQEALGYDKSLMIRQSEWIEKERLFRSPKMKQVFSIFHDCEPNNHPYQARQQSSASGSKEVVLAYLYGIINGANHYLEQSKN